MRPKTEDCGWASELSLEEILVSEPVGQTEFKCLHAAHTGLHTCLHTGEHPCYRYPSEDPNFSSTKK